MGIKERYRGPTGKTLPGLNLDLEEAIARLNKLFATKQVALAYLFGSYATGTNNPSSDLDLAVLMADQKNQDKKLYLQLFTAIQETLGTERVDLLNLDNASPLMKMEIVRSGRVIYARTEDELNNFEMKTIQEYLDTAYLRKVQNNYLKKRVEQWYSEKKA